MVQQEGCSTPARVLLIEDDPRVGMMLGEMLRAVRGRGLVISQTEEIDDAAQELSEHGATCVLLDVAHRDAVQAVEQLGAASPDTPIIVLADDDDEELGVAAVRAGAQDYLLKSELNASVLGRAVRYAVERKRSEVALALQALHDPLTSLPNRALFLDRLRVALDRSRRTGSPVVVLFLDVDGFKEINDSLGHTAGDLVLRVLADRFRGLLRPMDTVARFGGDEFTFLFEGLQDDGDAALVAQRISRSAGLPMALADAQTTVSVSIGVTIVTDPDGAIEDVVRQADVAMYRAKERGGARFEVFDGVIGRLASPRSELERGLPQAVARSELRVHYQPRVSLAAEAGLVGFEALVRCVLCLEVSEGAVEAQPELATRQLAALNEMGIKPAIDDFGTDDASSITLSRLPVDILKIDQTLVSRLGNGDCDGAVAVVTAAVQLGHTLGLSVVAEGVETDAQLAQLRDLGCDGAQGYLFSQPIPEERVRSLLGRR